MAGDTDFLTLYQELGLGADCSLQEIKRAYRKRVGALHPDRGPGDPSAMRDLQQLNVLYASALEFQRRHGRLPGAAQPLPTQSAPAAAPLRPAAVPSTTHPTTASVTATPRWVFGGMLATLGLLALWAWTADDHGQPPPGQIAASAASQATSASVESTIIRSIDRGAPREHVRALHGDPVNGSEQRWEYGPSWVTFRCGVVSDWYSSPLRPLKVAASPAPSPAPWSPPENCQE